MTLNGLMTGDARYLWRCWASRCITDLLCCISVAPYCRTPTPDLQQLF